MRRAGRTTGPGWRPGCSTGTSIGTPPWDDQSLSGKRILIYGEQGLGDQIMFASCLPDLLAEVAGCVLDCDPRLVGLFRRSFPDVTVIPTPQPQAGPKLESVVEAIDFQLPIGDLGGASAPARTRFLRVRATCAPLRTVLPITARDSTRSGQA